MAKVLVLYYSAYGHIEAMANAVAEGAREAGATVDIKRVPELVPAEVAKASHYKLDQAAPVAKVEDLANYDAIVVGTGINLLIPEWELPTDRATSLLAAGADVGGAETLDSEAGEDLADRVLSAYAERLLGLVELARADPAAARARVLRDSLTLGTEVRVHLPGGDVVDGRARELDPDGALVVDLPTGGQLTVTAADIEHLR